MGQKLRIGVHLGDGPPPGFKWSVIFVSFVRDEAMKFLSEPQYQHLVEQFWQLASQDDPRRSDVVSVDAIENFHELRDKGGILGGLNVRIFYYVDDAIRAIVVIGAALKQNDGPTPQAVKIRMRLRLRAYLSGDYGQAKINLRKATTKRN